MIESADCQPPCGDMNSDDGMLLGSFQADIILWFAFGDIGI